MHCIVYFILYRSGNILGLIHYKILLTVSTQLNILFSTLFNSILHHLRLLGISKCIDWDRKYLNASFLIEMTMTLVSILLESDKSFEREGVIQGK